MCRAVIFALHMALCLDELTMLFLLQSGRIRGRMVVGPGNRSFEAAFMVVRSRPGRARE